jgi:hypothetical protein
MYLAKATTDANLVKSECKANDSQNNQDDDTRYDCVLVSCEPIIRQSSKHTPAETVERVETAPTGSESTSSQSAKVPF